MREVKSKTRRNLVVAGATGLATVVAPTIVTRYLVSPAQATPPQTGEVKVQFAHKAGRWGIPRRGHRNGYNTIPLEIENQFGEGARPVVHEVQLHVRIDYFPVRDLALELAGPDGYFRRLMHLSGNHFFTCSHKGIDITFVDTDVENCCAAIQDAYPYCPSQTASTTDRVFNLWGDRYLHGVFHTNKWHSGRILPKFNGKPAVGTWLVRAHNFSKHDFKWGIKQIDLTVYSRW